MLSGNFIKVERVSELKDETGIVDVDFLGNSVMLFRDTNICIPLLEGDRLAK